MNTTLNKKKEVLVIGACGFTGSYVVPELLKKGYRVRCMVRDTTDRSVLKGYNVSWVKGDLEDIPSMVNALQGVDALINIASLGFGHAPFIVKAAQIAGVHRTIFFSTTAIFTTLNAPSKIKRLAAEETICKSGLAYTILRPTMIYGSSRDRNMCRLIRFLKKWSAIPVVGSGHCLQQPVYVKDLALAVKNTLVSDKTIKKCYNVSGGIALEFNEIIDCIGALIKKNIKKIHLPLAPIIAGLNLIEQCGLHPPIKSEQILRLNEDKAFDYEAARQDFGYSPREFKEGIGFELQEMGLIC
ncbi:MAG: NAD(P)H-binding protein [Desulfobacterales bacterium]|nr:NAD(P)H-binding protein [Desulfobacterales bacterium]